MTQQFLHIAYLPSERNWLLKIMSRLHQSSSTTLRTRLDSWGESPLREMGLALSTKFTMISQITRRVDAHLECLHTHLDNKVNEIKDCIKKDAAYIIPDQNLPYELLVDIDSFLFESRSTYEIVGGFLKSFHKRILEKQINETEMIKMLETRKIDTRWIQELRDNRKLFFHETAPWIALYITAITPLRFELVVLKKNIKEFTNPDNYFFFNQLREIYMGFNSSMGAFQNWIIEQIRDFEERENT